MLKKVEVYSSVKLATDLPFDESDPVDVDLVQVTNIDGIDPVKASIDIVSSGNADGAVSMDPSVPTRNIVLTIRPNPDWINWTYESLRQVIYSYFVPKCSVKLIFYSDEIGVPVGIVGTVESCDANPFTKDPEYTVSIICPDPYFTAIDATVITGTVIDPADWESQNDVIHVNGNIPIGIQVKLPDGFNAELYVQAGDPGIGTFHVIDIVTGIFQMGSIPLHKYIAKIDADNGSLINMLSRLQLGSLWPILYPGDNPFAVMGVSTGFPWELTYFEKYSGL